MSLTTDACHLCNAWLRTEVLMDLDASAVPPLYFFQGTQTSEINTAL